MRTSVIAIALCSVLVACGDPDPKSTRPNEPDANDPAFTARGLRNWYLIGDGTTPGDNQLTAIVTAPSGTDFVDAYIPGLPPIRTSAQSDGFAMDLSIESLPAGAYDILFSANGSDDAFAKFTMHRSAAYYVQVTTDYDFADPTNIALMYIERLHNDHPEMVITHFWAPYTYTDPLVTPARRDALDVWIKKMRDEQGDEIGLHIHPYCHFVESAGQTCITDQSTVYPTGDDTGYTIKLAAYGHAPMSALLQRAHVIFNERGLGTPTTFRAGGWTADINTLKALADNGYVADTSALNWKYIAEEWEGSELLSWNMMHWNPINDTSQPYYPNENDVLSGVPSNPMISDLLPILEVPDNGVMIDYVSDEEMAAIFNANWDGAPIATPLSLMMGFHPAQGFGADEYTRVDHLLDLADMHLASRDLGPVVYVLLKDIPAAFPPPQSL
jgi:hypothetical protein